MIIDGDDGHALETAMEMVWNYHSYGHTFPNIKQSIPWPLMYEGEDEWGMSLLQQYGIPQLGRLIILLSQVKWAKVSVW